MVRFARPALAAVLFAVMALSAGCSGGGTSGSGLETALARIQDTPANQEAIDYDNTAELVSLVGKNPGADTKGFAPLRGMGAAYLLPSVVSHDTGLNMFAESYAITVGSLPLLTLIAGGQDAAGVTGKMTKLGWKKGADGTLTAPSEVSAGGFGGAGQWASLMVKVHAVDSDVLIGGGGSTSADLGQIGAPSGPTLADDPIIKGLAGCLGNVVAATISRPAGARAAVGIAAPPSATAVPHAEVCVSWPDQAAADAYAAKARKYLTHASVTNVGGDTHVIKWEADSPNVQTVFNMMLSFELPGPPNCAKLTPAAAERVIGCS
jgi:hypothetical protein